MERFLQAGEIALVYNTKLREYGIKLLDGGSSVQVISCCPWCGRRLPSSLRDDWFDRLESLGLEPEDSNVPIEMQTDTWWKNEGL